MFAICLALFPPSIKFRGYLEGYLWRHVEPSPAFKGVSTEYSFIVPQPSQGRNALTVCMRCVCVCINFSCNCSTVADASTN